MGSERYIKNTLMLLLFAFLFIGIFGFWLRKRILSFDFIYKSKLFFLLGNYELIGGVLIGISLLFIVMFL
ncbi:hypothetical protein AKG34_11730 [Peribacillus butanolivorans]|nr:hypothetical protein AKG34_11730 [Peribacillus butanolivorans]